MICISCAHLLGRLFRCPEFEVSSSFLSLRLIYCTPSVVFGDSLEGDQNTRTKRSLLVYLAGDKQWREDDQE